MTKLEHAIRSIYEADSRQEELESWQRFERIKEMDSCDKCGSKLVYSWCDAEKTKVCMSCRNEHSAKFFIRLFHAVKWQIKSDNRDT